MSQDTATRLRNFDKVKEQVRKNTPASIIEAIANQIDRAEDAATRIIEEGSVVRDLKGTVIPHPAIVIEQNAVKLYTELIKKWL